MSLSTSAKIKIGVVSTIVLGALALVLILVIKGSKKSYMLSFSESFMPSCSVQVVSNKGVRQQMDKTMSMGKRTWSAAQPVELPATLEVTWDPTAEKPQTSPIVVLPPKGDLPAQGSTYTDYLYYNEDDAGKRSATTAWLNYTNDGKQVTGDLIQDGGSAKSAFQNNAYKMNADGTYSAREP